MYTALWVGFVICAVWYRALQVFLQNTQHLHEPKLVGTSVPFFGPSLGIALQSIRYLVGLHNKHGLPIYTLRVPFQRIYVINIPSLIRSTQRQVNALAFASVGRDFGFMFSGLKKESQEIIYKAYSMYGNGFAHIIHEHLKPGPRLDEITSSAVRGLNRRLVDFEGTLGLYDTVRHNITLTLTDAVYGPQNPYQDPIIEKSWVEFVPGIKKLLFSFFPSLTARKNLKARARIVAAMQKYFENDGHLQGSSMIKAMYEKNTSYGMPLSESSKMEIALSLALLSSSAITCFWLIIHMYSDSKVISEIRHELMTNIVEVHRDGNGKDVRKVYVRKIKDQCPILLSTVQEVFRYRSSVLSTMTINQDTMLTEDHFLKKGGVIMIPGPIVHKDPAAWGQDVNSFDHRRFQTLKLKKRGTGTSVFRPFGAGETMCPGRYFSTSFIMTFAAMMALQYDVAPAKGEWKMPTTEGADLWNAMPKPDHDVEVHVTPREETKDVEWKFMWGELPEKSA